MLHNLWESLVFVNSGSRYAYLVAAVEVIEKNQISNETYFQLIPVTKLAQIQSYKYIKNYSNVLGDLEAF